MVRLKTLIAALAMLTLLGNSGWTSDGLRSLSHQLEEGLKGKKNLSLGVLNFPYVRGCTSTGSHLVAERLLTYLVQDGHAVIERRFIETMLEQKMLWECGLTDPASMRELATVLGVDAIVAGTLSDISDNSTEVMARVINVEGAEILAAGSVIIPRLWLDLPRIPRVAQVSVMVPPAFPQIGSTFQKVKTAPNAAGERRQHYQPSPVPVFGMSHRALGRARP